MTEPLNVAACGECFESFAEPATPMYSPADEVRIHAEAEGHRTDVYFTRVDGE